MAITGTNSGEILNGTAGNDEILGLGGNDMLLGVEGNDTLYGGDGNDDMRGSSGNDVLIGGNGNDLATGGSGADVFVVSVESSAASNAIYDFELGIDSIDVSALGIADFDTLQKLLLQDAQGNAGLGFFRNDVWATTLITAVTRDDLVATDFLYATSTSNDTISGGTLRDDCFGGLGNDTISGGLGSDRLFGEGGNDVLFGNTAGQINGTLDGVDMLYGGAGNDQLYGGSQNDLLFGGDGNDTLDGGADADVMTGGAGADTYVLRAAAASQNDRVVDFDIVEDKIDVSAMGIADFETVNALSAVSTTNTVVLISRYNGLDTLFFLSGVLPGSLTTNNFVYASTATNDTLSGADKNDDLFGALGNDILSGGLGNDRLFGEQGDDQIFGYLAADADGSASPTADGNDLLFGGAGNDQLFGGKGDDALNGGIGNDILSGGVGNDTLDGGLGTDTASYLTSATAVTIRLWENTAAGGAAGDTLINIENITGSRLGNDTLVGNEKANVLNGSEGADYLNGREGNDIYFVDNTADVVADRSGIDTVNSSVSYILGSTLENLNLLGADPLNGTGNALANTITGTAGNNLLNGLDGTDTVSYANATAGVTVNLGLVVAQNTLGAGTDTLLGFENLVGSNFNDTLSGSAANNVLTGGGGADRLTGGAGSDSFVLGSLVGFDTITDFSSGIDKIKISRAGIRVGDGDTVLEGAVLRTAGTGGFANTAELVILQQDIVGSINTTSAAAAIGSATAAYALGQKVLFAVDNGTATGLFWFAAANTNAIVEAGELTEIALIGNSAATALADYGLIV